MSLIKSKFKEQVNQNGYPFTLEIRKYDRKVFFNNLWDTDPQLVKSRGAVFIKGVQVVHPMDKCFNYGENDSGMDIPLNSEVVAYKKLNGYMLNLTYVTGTGWIVSTTGDAIMLHSKTENKFLEMGVAYLRKYGAFNEYIELQDELGGGELTMTFEVCHPDDPHIVVELLGLHKLCYQYGGKTVPLNVEGEPIKTTVQGILNQVKEVKHEGFMVYDTNGNLLFKLKSPYYLTKKWIQRGGSKKVWSGAYKERLDEEYYPVVKYLRANFSRVEWDLMSENSRSEAFLIAYEYVTNKLEVERGA